MKNKQDFLRATYSGIPVYFNPNTNEIKGRNVLFDLILDIILWVNINVFMDQEFEIKIKQK